MSHAGVVAQNRAGCNIENTASAEVVIEPAVAEACARSLLFLSYTSAVRSSLGHSTSNPYT